MDYVELGRRFVPHGQPDGRSHTWDDLLAQPWAVVLAEALSGKSTELRAQAARLAAAGEPALCLDLSEVAASGLIEALHPKDEAGFRQACASRSRLYVFLDSFDEARLRQRSLREALLGVLRGLASLQLDQHESCIVISSRGSDWRPNQTQEMARLLEPIPPKHRAHRVFALEKLDHAQIRSFAKASGIRDSEGMLAKARRAGLLDILSRPGDIKLFGAQWEATGRLGTYTEAIDALIRGSLREGPDRPPSPLSDAQAVHGAEELALALVLSGEQQLLVARAEGPSPSQPAADDVLSAWSPEEREALLRLPLFDQPTYGRVRFHHRVVQERLAARRLLAMHRHGVRLTQLERLLFPEVCGVAVLPLHLAGMTAWVAGDDPTVRRKLLRVAPDDFLEHGDPTPLDPQQRALLWDSLVDRYQRHPTPGHRYSPPELERFARPELGPTLALAAANALAEPDLRVLALRMIEIGKLEACADAALLIALDTAEPPEIREFAIRAAEVGGPATVAALRGSFFGADLSFWTEPRLFAALVSATYPNEVTSAELVALLERLPGETKADLFDLAIELSAIIGRACPEAARSELVVSLLHLGRRFRGWPLVVAHHAVMRTLGEHTYNGPLTPTVRAVMSAMGPELEEDSGASFVVSEWAQRIKSSEILRREVFWHCVEQVSLRTKSVPRELRQLFGESLFCSPLAEDLPWLEVDAVERPGIREQLLAFGAIVHLEEHGAMDDSVSCRLCDRVEAFRKHRERRNRSRISTVFGSPESVLRSRLRKVKRARLAEEDRTNLEARCEAIAQGRDAQALDFVWFGQWRRDPFVGRPTDDEIAGAFGSKVAQAMNEGGPRLWRNEILPLPAELSPDHCPKWLRVAEESINRQEDAGNINWLQLSRREVDAAARICLWSLNGFPAWVDVLARAHPQIVREVLAPSLREDLSLAKEQTRELVACKLGRGADELTRLLFPEIESMLRVQDPASDRVLQGVTNALLISVRGRELLLELAPERTQRLTGEPGRFRLWWPTWFVLAPQEASEYVIDLSARLEPERLKLLLLGSLDRVYDWLRRPGNDWVFAAVTPEVLSVLIPFLVHWIPPKEDRKSGGSFRWTPRDSAEWVRDSLLQLNLEEPSAAHLDVVERWLVDPQMKPYARRLSRARLDLLRRVDAARPFSPEAALAWIATASPRIENADDLFIVVLDALADIADETPRQDFAYAHNLGTKEEPYQNWLAERLKDRGRGRFEVVREPEVRDKKKPDIRAARTGIAGGISLELKIAERWNDAELAKALEEQLYGQYVRGVDSSHGALILVRTDHHEHPRSEDEMERLVKELQSKAARLGTDADRRPVRLRVMMIDVRQRPPPLG